MSMSMDECKLRYCDRCGENQVHPFSEVCQACGYDHSAGYIDAFGRDPHDRATEQANEFDWMKPWW